MLNFLNTKQYINSKWLTRGNLYLIDNCLLGEMYEIFIKKNNIYFKNRTFKSVFENDCVFIFYDYYQHGSRIDEFDYIFMHGKQFYISGFVPTKFNCKLIT